MKKLLCGLVMASMLSGCCVYGSATERADRLSALIKEDKEHIASATTDAERDRYKRDLSIHQDAWNRVAYQAGRESARNPQVAEDVAARR